MWAEIRTKMASEAFQADPTKKDDEGNVVHLGACDRYLREEIVKVYEKFGISKWHGVA